MGVMATPERVDFVVKALTESIEYAKTLPRVVKDGKTLNIPYGSKNGVH